MPWKASIVQYSIVTMTFTGKKHFFICFKMQKNTLCHCVLMVFNFSPFFSNLQVDSWRTTIKWFSWSYRYECRSSPFYYLVCSWSEGNGHRYCITYWLPGVSLRLSDWSISCPCAQWHWEIGKHHQLEPKPHRRQDTVCSLCRYVLSTDNPATAFILNQY